MPSFHDNLSIINSPDMTFNSSLMQTSYSNIIKYEIPGYDVIFIPKPSPFVNSNNLNMQHQDINFLNYSSPSNYDVSNVNGISAGESSTHPIIIDSE
jgi:hypothetical protein